MRAVDGHVKHAGCMYDASKEDVTVN